MSETTLAEKKFTISTWLRSVLKGVKEVDVPPEEPKMEHLFKSGDVLVTKFDTPPPTPRFFINGLSTDEILRRKKLPRIEVRIEDKLFWQDSEGRIYSDSKTVFEVGTMFNDKIHWDKGKTNDDR